MAKASELRIQQLEKKLAHERELVDRLEQNQSALYEQLGFTSNAAERNNLNRQIESLGKEIESALDRYEAVERELSVVKGNSSLSQPSNDDQTVNSPAPGNTYIFHGSVGSVGNQGNQTNVAVAAEGDQIRGISQSAAGSPATNVNAVQGNDNQVNQVSAGTQIEFNAPASGVAGVVEGDFHYHAVPQSAVSRKVGTLSPSPPRLPRSMFEVDAVAINDRTVISSYYITWGEYQLFLKCQAVGQFHSQAEGVKIPLGQENQPVTRIPWQDARWFCAWLATQANLQPEEGTYFYRLPTETEVQQVASVGNWIPFTDSPQNQGDAFQVVRVQLSDRYKELLNYLANGRWKEADRKTARIMLEVAGQTDRGYLDKEDIEKSPCEDLRILDQLWIQFSGGRFGFSVQRDIYASKAVGGDLDGKYDEETWLKFCDRVKWREGDKFLDYDQLTFDLIGARGHLPRFGAWRVRRRFLLSGSGLPWAVWCVLFSRTSHCNL